MPTRDWFPQDFPEFVLDLAMVDDRLVQDIPELLILILPILAIVILLVAMIVGGNNGSDSMKI